MGSSCPVKIYFTSKLKNCFVNISPLLAKDWSNIWKNDNGVKAIHLDFRNRPLYISWGGHIYQAPNDSRGIEISRKFGELLGLVEGQEVVATAIVSVKSCEQISFFPTSKSDWEITETNASFIEGNLINQLRIVWEGLKIPIWFQKNNCVVVTIGEIRPGPSSCSQIVEFTKVQLIGWKEVETEERGFDIPIPPGLVTSPGSTDSERSGESSPKSSSNSSSLKSSWDTDTNTIESSSLDNSANIGVSSNATAELSSGNDVHSNISEASSLNSSSSSGIGTLSATESPSVTGRIKDSKTIKSSGLKSTSAGDLHTKSTNTFAALQLGRSLHQAGDKYEQTYTPSYPLSLRTHPLTGVVNMFSMLLGPSSADGENGDKFRTYPPATKGMQAIDYSIRTSKKHSITSLPVVTIVSKYYRVQNLSVCDDVIAECTGVQSLPCNLLQQPSTVFVYNPDVACLANRMSNDKRKKHGGSHVGDKYVIMMVSMHRMFSTKEKSETSPTKSGQSTDNTPSEDFKDSDPVKLFDRKRLELKINSRQRNVSSGERLSLSSSPATIVRLVVTSQRNFCSNEQCSFLSEDLLSGHVAVKSLIRRQLKLGVKSTVQINRINHKPSTLLGLVLNPFGPSARKIKSFNNDDIVTAFNSWIIETTTQYPLILSSRMLVEFNITPEIKCEFLLSGIGSDSPPSSTAGTKIQYFEISERTLSKASVTVGDVFQPSRYLLLSPYPVGNTTRLDEDFNKSPISSLGGFDTLYETCVDFLLHGLAYQPISQQLCCSTLNSNTLLLYGSGSTAGGSGKTSLAHALCNTLGKHPVLAHVSVIECVSLRGKRVETIRKSWQNTFNNAAWHQPAVIVFDDLDQLISAPSLLQENGPEAHYSLRLAQVFTTLLRKEITYNTKIVVIATATSRDSVHPTLLSSHGNHVFSKSVEIPLPGLDQRGNMVHAILKKKDLSLSDEDLREIAVRTEGCSPKDLNTLVARALQSSALRRSYNNQEERPEMCLADFNNALKCFKPLSLHGIKLHQGSDLTWLDVGGLDDIKQTLQETLEWPAKYPELYNSVPMRLPSGILLYGPPGCGKTMLAGVVAKECSLNFISIKGPELLNKYIGASEQAVRDLFHRAQSAKPCILFFDEFDSMAPRRGHDSTGVTDRVVNQLLTQLDGVEGLEGVYILGASSRPDLIDPALLRPGRLDKSLYCGMPDENARLEILRALSSKLELDFDVDLKEIARRTENFSGADLKALLSNAQLERIHKMKTSISDKPVKVEVRSNIVSVPQLKRGVQQRIADENTDLEKQVAVLQDNFFKNVYGKASHSPKPVTSESVRIRNVDMTIALLNMAPSVTPEERIKYASIYQSFKNSKKPSTQRKPEVITQRATLA
ncbi:peroxisome biogenesis factor 1-like [Dendronephthya gigantea]|uniref:peroxisome biogenesis factor 1-like n=1 Tax=Dendronephthya gigantea TaxID=151771 RepID=UPI00106BF262|nr:peroxisome biogenesis factor 1-like [Dendronephthya gigantea]